MHYLDWKTPQSQETVICVHGLSRNAHDFDYLADYLSDHFRVICPDLIGRGQSDWMPDGTFYSYPQYLTDLLCLISHLQIEPVHWIGTSMGGILGMILAIHPNSPIKSLVINDVGAFIPGTPLLRIAGYVKNPPVFSSLQQGARYIRQILTPFGPLSEDQWQHLIQHSLKSRDDEKFSLNYDPAIAHMIDDQDVDLWAIWSQIKCPVLLIRGEQSDVLPKDIAHQMAEQHPLTTLVEIPETGHAPALMDITQKELIRNWLLDQPKNN